MERGKEEGMERRGWGGGGRGEEEEEGGGGGQNECLEQTVSNLPHACMLYGSLFQHT